MSSAASLPISINHAIERHFAPAISNDCRLLLLLLLLRTLNKQLSV